MPTLRNMRAFNNQNDTLDKTFVDGVVGTLWTEVVTPPAIVSPHKSAVDDKPKKPIVRRQKNKGSYGKFQEETYIRHAETRRKNYKQERTFELFFSDLLAFKEEYGHCNVSTISGNPHATLGRWCSSLRTAMKQKRQRLNPVAHLTDKNIERLNALGFHWTAFDKRFQELLEFKTKHGHCNVPLSHASLRRWCDSLKFSMKLKQQNKKPTLKFSDENIERLNAIGFNWASSTKRKKEDLES